MKKTLAISLSTLTLSLAGCGSNVPACNDSETKELVMKIANDELTRQVGQEVANEVNLDVLAVRTQHTNEQTGAHECAAELSISGKGGANELSITYTVEGTDDGESFYVNVSGL
ncbi:hypothetical protein J8L70_01330 [Pseudoalteromonas sp. MMG010]|uniref:hypothetical protein n=1 Tax=Pseudoalteromonas sp. MMG010 TaxID=2822685 RepID=UPI001B39E6AC|nr:hypothetical protein [Pseudoalteromonas sp. MMG010]MBQ4831875.1 hypothetical protein [Pseudoalteromonas sp. MMG010]